LVKPGEKAYTFLSPLAQKGDILVIKIPLRGGLYYLVENRQPLGFDRVLPDSGILILRVNPEAQEGSGTVQVMNANPNARHFSEATYRLDRSHRNLFLDKSNDLAIIPLWPEGEKLGVLVATREESGQALKAALMVQRLLQRFPQPRRDQESQLLENCLASFKKFDFKTCTQIAQRGLKD